MPRGRRYEYFSISPELDKTFEFRDKGVTKYTLDEIDYVLNSHGFRSDEFTEKHEGKHVLFIGCSVTFGTGLPIEKTWSKILYNKLSKNNKLSGYFNLSFPGAASTEIIFNAVKYIQKFGAPEEIYFMVPEIMRGVHLDRSSAIMHSIQMYQMFELLCELLGIRLFSFSWDIEDLTDGYIQTANDFYASRFKTFYKIDSQSFFKSMYDYSKDKNEMFMLNASDGMHFGTAHHAGFIYCILQGLGDMYGF